MEPEGPTAEQKERNEPRQTSGPGVTRRQFLARTAVVLIAAVIGGVALVGLFSHGAPTIRPVTAPSPPVRGVACPGLQQAAEQLEAGNDSEFAKLVLAAARTGEAALERSDEIFGRPEKLALELGGMLKAGTQARDPSVDLLMSRVRAACVGVDRWA